MAASLYEMLGLPKAERDVSRARARVRQPGRLAPAGGKPSPLLLARRAEEWQRGRAGKARRLGCAGRGGGAGTQVRVHAGLPWVGCRLTD